MEFLVTDNHGAVIGPDNGSYKTDDNGRFVISGLTPGQTITVKETKTLPGYILNDKPQSVAIEAGDAQTLTFYNEAKSALLIVKRDSVTEQPLKGAEFQVLTADGKFVDDMGGALSSNGVLYFLRSNFKNIISPIFQV